LPENRPVAIRAVRLACSAPFAARPLSLALNTGCVAHLMVVLCNHIPSLPLIMTPDLSLVEDIRSISRSMAREWGFMGGSFAGTDLSPSAVHALIEIEKGGATARSIGAHLRLQKSSVSRLLRRLVESGEVKETPLPGDARFKALSLTQSGYSRVAAIHSFARGQVAEALGRLEPFEAARVLEGMRLYDMALQGGQVEAAPALPIEIAQGYRVGLIACITQLHVTYYARETGFGQGFESVVASGLAEFCNRLTHPRNSVWTAVRGDQIVGSVAVDGEDFGAGIAHLRWFIVDDSTRGSGLGRTLLTRAMNFVDESEFVETHLWTFSGLHAARHLYETLGFALAEERPGTQWGNEVLEQRFVRKRP
jgi:DNA-binding MarR family transcriptional regulator/GNAT superfamily N-acetyltransferase